MKPRDIFLARLDRRPAPRAAVGSATSTVTTDLMEKVGAFFPEAHLDVEPMVALAAAGYTELGYDNVMPLFSVWHESAALGCQVDWGTKGRMPDSRHRLSKDIQETVLIPSDLLARPPCAVPLAALRLLKQRYGDEVAVVGKVFGPWTLGYHVYGVDEFLMATLTDPDAVRRAMRALIQVTLQFGTAQIEAGADALTLADHATRDLCRPTAYRDFLLEIHQELNQRLACPLILHICGDRRRRGREGGPSYRGHRSGVRRAVGRALAKPAAAGQGSQAAKRRRRRGLRNQMRRGPSGKRVCSTAFRRPGSGIRVPAACSA